MPRPSNNTDQQLILAARELLPITGSSGLSLRQVADKAGVNLGMFHYHFKTKEEFVRRVLQGVYDEFFKELSFEASKEGTPEDRLRKALGILGKFSREKRALLVSLLRDVVNGDQEVTRFVKENFGRHFKLILELIRECKKDGVFQSLPEPVILLFLVGAVGIPHLVVEILSRSKVLHPFGLKKLALQKLILTEVALQRRIDLGMKAVSALNRE